MLQFLANELTSHRKKFTTWNERRTNVEARSQQPLIGLFFQWFTSFCQNRIEKELAFLNEKQRIYEATNQEYINVQEMMQHALAADPEYRQCEASRQQIEEQGDRAQKEASTTVKMLHETIQDLLPTQPLVEPFSAKMLQQYVAWFHETRLLLENRAKLLQDWRKELEARTEQLTPELLRYADVVGATCIGVATAKGLADIEFDFL